MNKELLKIELRKLFRKRRKNIPVSYRYEAAHHAAALFSQLAFFEQSTHIACYLPYKDEFDSSSIIEAIWKANKYCYLPRITKEKILQFVRYCPGDQLQANCYSILEPAEVSEIILPLELDSVLLPLVAFDKQGGRLGTGGGYYDRTFAFLKTTLIKKPRLIGVGYAIQQADFIPIEAWDILVSGVITEKEFIFINN